MNIIKWLDLTDIYRTFHPIIAEYTFLLIENLILPKIDYMLVHEISLNKLERTEKIHIIFSDQKRIELEINNRKLSGKSSNI